MRGGQRQVLLLLRLLRNARHDSILLARRDSPLTEQARQDGFCVHPAGLFATWRFSKNVDIVHAHDARAHTLAAIASRKRFVVSRRVAFPVRRSLLSRWKYWRATRFLAVSRFVARQLSEAGISHKKIDVVYDGVESTTLSESWEPEFPAVALASEDPQKGRDLI